MNNIFSFIVTYDHESQRGEYVLFASREVRIEKNCALGRHPRQEAQFFSLRNNITFL